MPPQQLTIALDERGQLTVTGDLANKVLALGMLDIARHIILTAQPDSRPRLAMPNGPLPDLSRFSEPG